MPARLVPVCLAVGAGAAVLVALPPYDLWWLAPVGVALLALAVRGRRAHVGALLGFLAGLVLFVPLLSWTLLHVGSWPGLLLAAMQAAYVAMLGAVLAWLAPLAERWPWIWPPLIASAWVLQEAVRIRFPFGGFPWGRLAFSQGDSPLLRLAALGGAPLVTFGVALAGGLLAWSVVALRGSRRLDAVAAFVAAVLVALSGFAVPLTEPAGRTAVIAIVQGNVPRLGLDFNAQRRAVLDNHVDATIDLANRVRAGTAPAPDLVVWPENASDIDPLVNPDAAARIDEAAAAIGAPILLGAVLRGPGENQVRNVGLVWRPGAGPGDRYVKRHPVPFAEYVPLRPVVRRITSKVDLIRADFVAGAEPGVLRIPTAAGTLPVGDVICFEVGYDNLVRDAVRAGAGLLVVQTNNATFNVAEAEQQLAMVRLRAVEHGRPALMASTVGVSAFVDADGRVTSASRFNTQAVLSHTVRLGEARTLATRLGVLPEALLVGFVVGALAVAFWLRRRTRDREHHTVERPGRGDIPGPRSGARGDPHVQRGGEHPADRRPAP